MKQIDPDWLRLALAPGVGPRLFLDLIRFFGSAQAVVAAPRRELENRLPPAAIDALVARAADAAVEAALEWATRPGCRLLTLLDAEYPTPLAEAPGAPPLLFARGRCELLASPMLAVVGSRHPTPQGRSTARDFAAGLAASGYTVVSGLAHGIDSAAHEGALGSQASTVAVVGTGIDRVYPAANRDLAHRIAAQGLILSEFPLGSPPLAAHFPRRNRIIAGLGRACLVVEAGIASGSLITARYALEAGREVMALPGSIHNPQARGCHRLLKEGARLVESLDDIIDEVGQAGFPAASESAVETPPLLAAMGFDPVSADQLAPKLGLTAPKLYEMLLGLELEGRVASLPGGRFQRLF
ncbi:DNA-processing protein DprA [Paludibacterium yongneupense]|uniref:DNA-processing protein DprA n=1 Tax=Paludibacterium yongneupense TaxID=400061 RepID=UPI0004034B71|nr:DNA-processing protein DprA [Paludibacterium yongneupense]